MEINPIKLQNAQEDAKSRNFSTDMTVLTDNDNNTHDISSAVILETEFSKPPDMAVFIEEKKRPNPKIKIAIIFVVVLVVLGAAVGIGVAAAGKKGGGLVADDSFLKGEE